MYTYIYIYIWIVFYISFPKKNRHGDQPWVIFQSSNLEVGHPKDWNSRCFFLSSQVNITQQVNVSETMLQQKEHFSPERTSKIKSSSDHVSVFFFGGIRENGSRIPQLDH